MPLVPGSPLVPRYTTAEPNQNIALYEGPAELIVGGATHAGSGRVLVEWLPSPIIRFVIEFPEPFPMPEGDDAQVKLISLNLQKPAFLTAFGFAEGKTTCKGYFTEDVDLGTATELTEVVFHVCNFVDYLGAGLDYPDGSAFAGRMTLEGDPWRITIDRLHALRERRTDGFDITHCGHLERIDGKPFSREDAVQALGQLDYFLSFVAGFWVASVLLVGKNAHGATWERWRVGRIDRQKPGFSWFTVHVDINGLSQAYAGYQRLLGNLIWEDAIDYAIYWYVSARRTSDTGPAIVMVQTGLELLGWVTLVEDRKLLTSEGYDKLWASDKLRLLLGQVGVDRTIPASLTALASSFGKKDWLDGPHVVTEHRNALVHPALKNRAKLKNSGVAQMEAEMLSLLYLELAILNLLGYKGSFHNRTDDWSHEMVPWP